ncbi:MAG: tetratricopeptide repeat protein [Bryobacteraceae bacterium]
MRRLPVLLWILFALCAARADTVLVLPFFNVSGTGNLDWIGESFAETVRESLTAEGVLMLERADRQEAFRRLSIRPYALLTRASVIKIAETLDASHVIYGQYNLAPAGPTEGALKGSLTVTWRVINLKQIKQGPELTEIAALEDLAGVETRVAFQALRAVAPKTTRSEEEFRNAWPPVRVDALENYTRGLLASTPEQQHRLFTQAARLEPSFSQPRFELGRINTGKREYRVAAGWLDKVEKTSSHYFEAQFLLGLCRYHTGDYAGAEAAFREVSASVPLNEVWNNLGAAQGRRRSLEAPESFRRAIEGDPADPDYHFNLGYTMWKNAKFTEAAESFRAALDRKPDDSEATIMLGRCLKQNGPRPGDPKSDGMERLKMNFEETAYRQLKLELGVK